MIKTIIKDNMERMNCTQRELSLLTNISEKTISLLLSEKIDLSVDISLKLDRVFDFEPGTLFETYNKLKTFDEIENNEEIEFVKFIKNQDKYKLMDTLSIKMTVREFFHFSQDNFKKALNENVIGYSKFKDKPLAFFWIALCQKKHRTEKSIGQFKKSTASTVYNKIFKDILSNESFDVRFANVQRTLSQNGIILKGEPFIKDSTIKGVSLKLANQRFIFLSDMNKREYEVWLSLLHELIHFYGTFDDNIDEAKIDKHARMLFRAYLDKHNIPVEHEFYQVIELLENEKYDWLHKFSNMKISFGDIDTLLSVL